MGAHKLLHKRFEAHKHQLTTAACVDISPCGNFCAVGYSSGHVDVYNMQSGIYRGSYNLSASDDRGMVMNINV